MSNRGDRSEVSSEEKMECCAACGGGNLEKRTQQHTFGYGVGDERVELETEIPVLRCEDCGFCVWGEEAEGICHEAVCRHLGVMTPNEVKSIRDAYGLTQREFAEVTELGEATLSRWERGVVIQNKAYNKYLCLLRSRENFEMLRSGKQSGEEDRVLRVHCGDVVVSEVPLRSNRPKGAPTWSTEEHAL